MSQVCLEMPAKAEYLLLGRLALAGIARTVDFDPELLADLKLAVTEACANAVRHAYEEEGAMSLRFAVDEASFRIVVEDEGTGFETRHVDAWEPDTLSEDGMGLAIIRAVVDELDIGSGPGGRGTRLTLTKRF
jgi:serine/threonine-protein kinase RsbW